MDKKMVVRHSEVLGEDLDVIVYGTAGQPVMAFAPLGQRPESLEEVGLVDELSDYLDAGVIQLFSVSNVDGESWGSDGYAVERAARQEAYYQAVCEEIVPLVAEVSGSGARPLALGFDLGATHAAVFALRRPDLFQGCVCLSGAYDASRYFGDWMDATLYDNTPCAFLPNMPTDHPYIALYNQRQLLFCCGQEGSEADSLRTTREIDAQLQRLGVEAWCDYWGGDVSHTWFWWKKQIRYFMPIVLEDVEKTTAAEKAAAKKKAPARRRAAAKKPAAKKAVAKAAEKDDAVTEEKPAAKKPAAKRAATAKATAGAAVKSAAEEKPAAAKRPAAKKAAAAEKSEPAKKPTAAKAAKAAEPAEPAEEKPAAKPAAKKTAAKATTKAAAAKATATKTAAKATTTAKAATTKAPAAKSSTATKTATTKAATTKAAATKKTAAEAPAAKKPAAKRTTRSTAKKQDTSAE
ncbi:alpha/beta hydrolase-fold protein [Thermophilibacter provencensis]|uniref:alpha/beta hydrolase-fold protein n=1 Tax=Thermophilibacter provencensis TaxID=1852386 RepID=UPI00094AEAEB|nr:alpha/beta hydrolase-fold protein [Thermophilibacter provencensis]